MELGTRAISRYCAPADEATGCNQCDLSAQEQCNQTFYLKQQNEILKAEPKTQSDLSVPTSTVPVVCAETLLTQSHTNDLSPILLPVSFFASGIILGLAICIIVLKLTKRL